MNHLDARQRAMLVRMGLGWAVLDRPEGPAAEDAQATPERIQVASASDRTPAARVAQLAPEAPEASAHQARVVQRPAPVPPTPRSTPVLMPVRSTDAAPASTDGLDWAELEQAVSGCQACTLCESRRQTVFGVGDRQAQWLIVGAAPGESEDLQGEPFVGQAGKLLDNMLKAVGRSRQQGTYIVNVLKCRPPRNRNPAPEELQKCEPFLRRQIELVRPQLILAMGRVAVQSLLQTSEPIGRLRGRVHQHQGLPLIVTYHPADLLLNPTGKANAWEDLCLAMAQGLSAPASAAR